jgi:hypothetical protein
MNDLSMLLRVLGVQDPELDNIAVGASKKERLALNFDLNLLALRPVEVEVPQSTRAANVQRVGQLDTQVVSLPILGKGSVSPTGRRVRSDLLNSHDLASLEIRVLSDNDLCPANQGRDHTDNQHAFHERPPSQSRLGLKQKYGGCPIPSPVKSYSSRAPFRSSNDFASEFFEADHRA